MLLPVVHNVRRQRLQLLFRHGNAGGRQRIAQMIGQRGSAAGVDVVLAVGRLSERRIQAVDHLLARSLKGGILLCVDADDILLPAGNFLYFDGKLAGERGADLVHRRAIGKTDGDQRPTSEVDAVAGATLDSQADKAGCRKDEGEDDERPLLAEKVKV